MSAIQQYQQLDYMQKKEYLSHILAIFADYSAVAKDVLTKLSDASISVTEAEMEQIYELFVEAISNSSKEKLWLAIEKLTQLQTKLQAIHQQEEADKAGENPEDILSTI
jgi:hypothetical protein